MGIKFDRQVSLGNMLKCREVYIKANMGPTAQSLTIETVTFQLTTRHRVNSLDNVDSVPLAFQPDLRLGAVFMEARDKYPPPRQVNGF